MRSSNGKFENLHLTVTKCDYFVGAHFVNCFVDDVTNAPFDKTVFTNCYFENTKFRSHYETGVLTLAHENSFIEDHQ